jgi:3D (Asp-Asp-Asp) domain-containing protein
MPSARAVLIVLGLFSALSLAAADAPYLLPKDGGQVNVRDFGAKGDGRSDDTAAFTKAIKDEADGYRCIYVPKGVYLISDTIGWRCRRTLVGESRDGVVIKLKDGCAGYSDPAKPKPVVQTAMEGRYGNDSRANAAFDNYLINLTIDSGKRNPGAIALAHTTHNMGVVENVLVRSGDGAGAVGIDLSQTEFGPGMLTGIEIDGFDVGLKTPGNVSNTVLQHVVLKHQKVVGIDNNHPLSLYDLHSDNTVPALRNSSGWSAQTVLIGAVLNGGAKDGIAIDNQGQMYLRDVQVQGYGTALSDHGQAVAGPKIDEYYHDTVHSVFPSKPRHLDLPIEDAPAVFVEPVEKWLVIEPKGKEDMTKALQAAIDSGAETIFLKAGGYGISDTVHLRGKLRRLVTIHGGGGASIGGSFDKFGREKPFLRIEGDAKQPPLVIEGLAFSAWPRMPLAVEVAGPRTVYFKYCRCPHPGGYVQTTPEAAGAKLFLDEMFALMELTPGVSAWVRQSNPENNPYGDNKAHPSYIVNRGAKVWILGLKTESPAVHAVTLDGGQTEILGGFFRDHVGFKGGSPIYEGLPNLPGPVMQALQGGVPAFITIDASCSATYTQYAWQSGAARSLQAVEVRAGELKEFRLDPNNQTVGLYSAVARAATDVQIESFTSAPELLRKGEHCVLRWKVHNAKSVQITPGVGTVTAEGEKDVVVTEPTTWTLHADGPGGSEEATTSVLMFRDAEPAATTTKPGLSCAMYEGQWNAVPNVAKLKPAATMIVGQPDLSAVKRKDNYALVFTGFVDVPKEGVWTFSTSSDDGSVLSIGSQLVVDNNGAHAVAERSGQIALSAGRHPVRMAYIQGGGGASLSVTWEGPGQEKHVVPASAWSHHE